MATTPGPEPQTAALRVARSRIIVGATVLGVGLVLAGFQSQFHSAALLLTIGVVGFGGAVKLLSDSLTGPFGQWFTALFEDRRYGAQIGYMEEIREDLDRVQPYLKEKHGRVLVIIDDLDRCEPNKAVEVLQAINLLLSFPSFIVCVGIDARVITRALERHYQGLLRDAGASGFEYLDKIVQIPFRIPDPTDDEVKQFLTKQLAPTSPPLTPSLELSSNWIQRFVQRAAPRPGSLAPERVPPPDHVDLATLPDPQPDPSAGPPPIRFDRVELEAFVRFLQYLEPNPRHLKRLVNVYRLVRTLASLKGDEWVYKNPDATIRWLIIAGQWPYTAYFMLRRYAAFRDNWGTQDDGTPKIPGDVAQQDPLRYLYKQIGPDHTSRRREFDGDANQLEALLQCKDGRLSWRQFQVVGSYAVNFNPAVEEGLRQEPSAPTDSMARGIEATGRARDVATTSPQTAGRPARES